MKKLVCITGASSGFGMEMAKMYSEAGYPTLLLARRVDKIKAMNLSNSVAVSVDVTDYNAFQSAINLAEATYGEIDLLINNAGIMLLGNIENQNPNEWQQMLNVNIMGVLNGTQLVLDKMKTRNCGTIINVSSIAGRKTFLNHAAYVATKFGVHAMTETIRQEVSGSNVRVLVIAPGAAETELLTHVTDSNIVDGYNEWKKIMDDEKSLDPKFVALSTKFMYEMPQSVSIRELVIADTKQDA